MMGLKIAARLMVRVIGQLWEHKLSSAIIIILVIAMTFVGTARFSEPTSALATASSARMSPPQATEQYFQGQLRFDSGLIWDALSPELIGKAQTSGATLQDLQAQLDEAREVGRSITQVDYVGGHPMREGRTMQFYVAAVQRSATTADSEEIFYVFTLDHNGKIQSIE